MEWKREKLEGSKDRSETNMVQIFGLGAERNN